MQRAVEQKHVVKALDVEGAKGVGVFRPDVGCDVAAQGRPIGLDGVG